MTVRLALLLVCASLFAQGAAAQTEPGGFRRLQLSDTFFCEGATLGDLNGDGTQDIVSGPYWYEGPDFERVHEFSTPVEADPLKYSDDFFAFVLDLDGDGRNDIFKIGFPGNAATWYRNPPQGSGHWTAHEVFAKVDNESPTLTDIDGDGRPELVCNQGGAFGYARADWSAPERPWSFHAISPAMKKGRFTHGLGVGDINGDGRVDVIDAEGWWEQPPSLEGDPLWTRHPVRFSGRGGGAQMFAYDIDGDGDADVVTSLRAHGFGLAWFEQVQTSTAQGGHEIAFVEHLLMDNEPGQNPWGVSFSALHALDLADIDGDGLLDFVTGKRHWSHGPKGDPKPIGPSVIYWFRLERTAQGARFVPHLVDDDSGVGTQVVVGDANGDGRPDILVGNKQGTFVHLQPPGGVSTREPALYQPPPTEPSVNDRGGKSAQDENGRALNLGFETGDLSDWTAIGDAFDDQPVKGDSTARRGLASSDHTGEYWIGGYEIHGDSRVGELVSVDFVVSDPWATYLVAGGSDPSTRVDIEDEAGQVICSSPGPNYEPLKIVLVDLREHLGRKIRIRIVDEHTGGWGHVNYDDFRFHASEPDIDPARRMFQVDKTEFSGLTPEEAAAAMTAPQGFHVDLIAAEPDLHQPVALAIDGKGRLWVAEAHSYPQRVPDEEAVDQILVFEDTDLDGSFETRTVFAQNLNLVSGLEVGLGGVWVGAAPYLMFIPDRDDDLVPDGPPEILLDGWEWQDTHETLNAFIWGPDGWLYGCHGVFTHSRVGAPGTPDEQREPINCGVWRYHPTRETFEVFAWGTSNPWGLDFDDHGQAFITACVIPHLFHMVQGGRYIRQAGMHFNPHAFLEIDTIADHKHYVGDNPHGGTNFSASAGGGHAHCGAMIYLGTSFPEEHRGRIFMNNIHGNRINCDSLERSGSGFVGRHELDLVMANDSWFRGINMKYGPDGAVYFIDWSDERACHSRTPEVWTRTNGRLFRLRYGEVSPVAMDMSALGDKDLAALQASKDEFRVRRARLELQGREAPDVRGELFAQLRKRGDTASRLRALWAAHACGLLDEDMLLDSMAEDDEYLVAWSIQLLCEDGRVSDLARARLIDLARTTDSAVVRLYLASALQRIAPDFELAEVLLSHASDADDPNIPTVLWYALEEHVGHDPERSIALAEQSAFEELRRFIVRRAAAESATREPLFLSIHRARDTQWRDLMLEELDVALRDARHLEPPEQWEEIYAGLAADPDEAVRDRALWIGAAFDDETVVPELTELLLDQEQVDERRLRALEAVATSGSAASSSALRSVLTEVSLRSAAIRGLSSWDDARTPPALLAVYSDLPDHEQDEVLATLSSRESFALALLAAVEADRLPRDDISQFVLRKLRALGSQDVDSALVRVWGVFRESSEERTARIAEWVEKYAGREPVRVRPSHGREIYEDTCGKCHTLFGEGGTLGPELTGSNRADAEYLWTNVLDPNAVIGIDYQVTVVRTFDGLLVTGVLQKESESSITLATETDEFVVAKEDIEERVLSDVSVMPEGQADTMSDRDRRDLITYLEGAQQTPPIVREPTVDALFNGLDLAGWSQKAEVWSVEDGAIVGRTQGLAANDFLISELELGSFRLEFDVKLVDNVGNSGVQFWSRALDDGDVAGYQADIGVGWWGKLYEEHGRGLLWAESGEAAVKEGQWNHYVIEATEERLRTWINGQPCVDLEDSDGAYSGRIALQAHSGGATEVHFKNFELLSHEDH